VLITGASGSGKSDLALRLIVEAGAALVADDRVILEARGEALWARAPERLRGMLEIRGMGVHALPFLEAAPLALHLEATEAQERLPEAPQVTELLGLSLPCLRLNLLHASAVAKVRLFLSSPPDGA
jgi:serine kinase of HPr protein (carbohydrate metabolism regulator)